MEDIAHFLEMMELVEGSPAPMRPTGKLMGMISKEDRAALHAEITRLKEQLARTERERDRLHQVAHLLEDLVANGETAYILGKPDMGEVNLHARYMDGDDETWECLKTVYSDILYAHLAGKVEG